MLDVGCGEGFAARALLERTPGRAVFGVDVDAAALRLPGNHRLLKPVCAAAECLPYASSGVEVVVCLEVIEHLADPEAALRELRRVAGGLLVLSVPHQPFFSLANLLRGKNWATAGEDPEHRHAWRQAAFVDLVARHAPVIAVERSFPWLIVVARPRGS